MADDDRSPVPALGGRHLARGGGRSAARGLCFSPDGRLLVVQDASKIIRLVETETGRTLARLESPDLCAVWYADLQPRRLAPGGDHPRRPGRARLGPAGHPPAPRQDRPRLGRAALSRRRPGRSVAAASSRRSRSISARSPLTWHPEPQVYESLIADLETMLARQPDQHRIRGMLAHYCNNLAWGLATAPESARDPRRGPVPGPPRRRAGPDEGDLPQHPRRRPVPRRPVRRGRSPPWRRASRPARAELDAFDLFFLAMAHHRLGRTVRAHDAFDRAVRWWREHTSLPAGEAEELAGFHAEAQSVLGLPDADFPDDVFAGPK